MADDPTELARLEGLYATAAGVRAAGQSAAESEGLYRDYVAFVRRFVPTGRVLDVGCGAGWSTHWFAERGFDATGIDLNPDAFEPPGHGRLRFRAASGTAVPAADGEFDVVAANQCLEHVPDPGRMLDEMVRVAKPGGVVCVVGPNLLAAGPSVAAATRYVWRNRPLWRVLVRTPDMPRHPFGNTLPEVVAAAVRNAGLVARKSLGRQPHFTTRQPDLRPPFHADNDAVWLCNPLDVSRHLRGRGCDILADVATGRGGWTRMLAGGTWVAARTPVGRGHG